jgi:uncharacterized protein
MSAPPDSSIADSTRIVLRPIGSPLPLGLLGLMVAGLMLSLLQVGTIPEDETMTVAVVMLGFTVPLQLLAAVFSFLARDTVAGTALGLFTGAWTVQGVSLLTAPPGSTSTAIGIFGLAVALAFFVILAGAAFGKAGPALVIAVGAARFAITGIYELTAATGIQTAAGVLGFVLVAVALYTALATEIEDVQGERKLPLGRRHMAAVALDAPFEDQLERIEHEAGVRQQL